MPEYRYLRAATFIEETRYAAIAVLFVCFLLQAAQASDLLVRSWTPSQDARQRSVLALLETREGYLWLGTGNGLLRFDGVDFTSFTSQNTPGILGDRISFGTLWEDPKGVIWAGTDFSGVLRNDHGHWQTLQQKEGLTGGKVLRIDGDESGAVWIYTERGVTRWRNGHLQREAPGEEDGPSRPVVSFSRQRTIDFAKAGLWRRYGNKVERFAFGHWSNFPVPSLQKPFENDVREIHQDALHRVWYSLFSYPNTVFCAEQGMLRRYDKLPPDALVSYEDQDGYLWLTDHEAHSSLWKDGHLYPLPRLKAPFLLQVLETRNGALWTGTAGTDLFKFRRRSFKMVPIAGTPEIASVLFAQSNGQVWAGGTHVLRRAPESGKIIFKPVQRRGQPQHWIQIKALAENARGGLLIGSRGVAGLEELTQQGFTHSGLVTDMVQAMLLRQPAETWIGSTSGLYRRTGELVQRVSTSPTRSLLQLSGGGLLAGTDEGPLLFRNGRQEQVLPSWSYGAIVAMRQDSSGAVWIATQDHGLVRFADGAFHVANSADGLPTNVLYSLEFDDAGDLWMGSDLGLMRVRGRSLERNLHDSADRLQVTLFDSADGLPASIFDPLGDQGVLRRPDGDLWFGTEQGVAVIRPSTLRSASPDTHPVIEEHEIDQSGLLSGVDLVLRPGQTNLQIHYSALGSDHPEQLIFRYRLQPYDRDWVYARNRRVAYYSHLPPGTYTFKAQAADTDGEGWIGGTASTSVRVLAPFYRSWWFLLLMALSLGSFLVYAVAQRRIQRLAEQRNRQLFTHRLLTTQEGERKRIAHELHDSIGQHLVLIRTLAMLPPSTSASGPGGHLQSIAEQAAVAIKEVETISYDLRPYQLDRLGLTKAVLSLIESFEKSSTVRIQCSIDNVDDFFPKELEINVYRIVQEALGNILRHAEANSASVTVTRKGSALRLVLQDDGKGFPVSSESKGSGLGLVGIHERAEALHGRATIDSLPGVGTTVTVEATQTFQKG